MSLENKNLLLSIREDIRKLSAYHVQNSSGMIKLDAMENPFPLPEKIFQSWEKRLSEIQVNRYPDPSANALREKLSRMLELDDQHALMFGNGSDELIQILMLGLNKDAKVLSIEPSFVMYRMIAQFCGLEYIGVNLNKDFSLDVNQMEQLIDVHKPEIIFIAQPNNPTGTLFKEDDLRKIASLTKGFLIIDEAYSPFTNFDSRPLLDKFENVIVMRTFSKAGLAGLRLGYLIGKKELLDEFEKLRLPYNINVLTQSLVECALDEYELLEVQAKEIIFLRTELQEKLAAMASIDVIPSEANFITIRLKKAQATDVANSMNKDGVLIKNLCGGHPLLENCLRLTVGSQEENELMLASLTRHIPV